MGLDIKLGGGKGGDRGRKVVGREGGKVIVEEEEEDEGEDEEKGNDGGTVLGGNKKRKRKFELDEDELIRIASEERSRAKRALAMEKVCTCPFNLSTPNPHVRHTQDTPTIGSMESVYGT